MTSTAVHSWLGNNNSDPIQVSYQITGDLHGADVDLTDDDEKDVEVQWSSGKLNQIFIYSPIDVRLRFNYTTTPQDFELQGGAVFQWDHASGIPCPLSGAINNLRISRLEVSDGDGDTVQVRYNKDATP